MKSLSAHALRPLIIARKKTGGPASDLGESDPRFGGRVREHNPQFQSPAVRKYRSFRDRSTNGSNWPMSRNSPRVFGAKCASNAISFLVLGSTDREFIIDVGEDRDACVDPSRQAAAKLQPGGLTYQRHDVRPRINGVGLSPPIAPEIGPEIRLPYLTASSGNRPFGPEPDAPARPRRVAERDIAESVIIVPERNLLPQKLALRLDHEPRAELRPSEWIAAFQGGNEARAVGVKLGELGAGRSAIPSPLQHGVEIPARRPDMSPVATHRPGVEVQRSRAVEDIGRRRRIGDQAVHVSVHVAISAIEAGAVIVPAEQRSPQKIDAALEAAEIAAGTRIGEGLVVIVDRLPEEAAPD